MIIDDTYFDKGILFIPNNKNINTQPTGTPSVQNELTLLIDVCERDLLLNALGVNLFEELKTANDDLPNADQKWRDLIDGKTYEISGKKFIWNGLKGFSKQSLIAYFVYCENLRQREQTLTTTGVIQNVSANAENVSATPKFIKVWNLFLNAYQSNRTKEPKILVNAFGEYSLDYSVQGSSQVSLYQFLRDNETDFAGFEFRFYESYNSFGI